MCRVWRDRTRRVERDKTDPAGTSQPVWPLFPFLCLFLMVLILCLLSQTRFLSVFINRYNKTWITLCWELGHQRSVFNRCLGMPLLISIHDMSGLLKTQLAQSSKLRLTLAFANFPLVLWKGTPCNMADILGANVTLVSCPAFLPFQAGGWQAPCSWAGAWAWSWVACEQRQWKPPHSSLSEGMWSCRRPCFRGRASRLKQPGPWAAPVGKLP